MKNPLFLFFFMLLVISACREKDKTPETKFISVPSLIREQVEHVDTSLYAIYKYVKKDTLAQDTIFLRREDFAAEAKEFMEIPDLSNPKIARRFREEPARYDEMLNRVMITYLPLDSINEEYKSIELIIVPNMATGDKVHNIIVKKMTGNRDGFMQKNLLWILDRSFQVTTITQQPGEPEKASTTRVVWNEDKSWMEETQDFEEKIK